MSLRSLLVDAMKDEGLSWVLEKVAQAIESIANQLAENVRAKKPESELRKRINRYRRVAGAVRNPTSSLRRTGD